MKIAKAALALAAVVTLAIVVPVGPATAAPRLSGLDCTTWVHNNDPLYGGVTCANNTGGTITFHADIVCGRALDVTGNSVTVAPGRVDQSTGHCAFYSTGIGHIGWTVE
ncbi:hypothetical protein [Kitasatospora sp. NPDC002040]|uniref:hypothetical protein n=1 Tax=Kitasatospora sp. NPDC002040 TaxID=3154661 RepID=UPI0033292ACE